MTSCCGKFSENDKGTKGNKENAYGALMFSLWHLYASLMPIVINYSIGKNNLCVHSKGENICEEKL